MSSVPTITLNDGTTIPQLGLGLYKVSDDDAYRSCAVALEMGYRHLDTAAMYGNEAGVGRAVAESGLARDDVFVTTKLWNDMHARAKARASMERSLELLGLDHVDLFLIHWPAPANGLYVEAWEQLIDFRSEGLTRSIGVSNFLPEHLDAIVDETGIVPSVNQIELHPTFQPDDLIHHCSDLGITIESWSPLGRSADLAHPVVLRVAEETGASPAQVILRWHLDRGFITFPKSTHAERIAENLAAVDVRLSSEQLAAIDALDTGVRVGSDPATVN